MCGWWRRETNSNKNLEDMKKAGTKNGMDLVKGDMKEIWIRREEGDRRGGEGGKDIYGGEVRDAGDV